MSGPVSPGSSHTTLGGFLFLEWLRRSGIFRAECEPLAKLAVAGGIISFWILISPLTSFGKRNLGPVAFGIFMAMFLVKVLGRLRKKAANSGVG